MARNHRIVGYSVGLLTALAAAYLPGMNALRGAPAHFRDLAVAVVTGEALVEKEPAQVQLGESVKITIEMEYYEPARPRARPSFTTSITTEWFDDKGEVKIGPFRSRQHYSASNFPMDFAWRLVNQPPAHIVQNY